MERKINPKELAQHLGFEVKGDSIYLPYERFRDMEYGVCVDLGGRDFHEIVPRVYVDINGEKRLGGGIPCYTAEFVLRTTEIGERKYVTEKQRYGSTAEFFQEPSEDYEMAVKGLIMAFHSKIGIDPNFYRKIYHQLPRLLPTKYSDSFVRKRVHDTLDRIQEVSEIDLPNSEKILDDLTSNLLDITHICHVDIHPDFEEALKIVYTRLIHRLERFRDRYRGRRIYVDYDQKTIGEFLNDITPKTKITMEYIEHIIRNIEYAETSLFYSKSELSFKIDRLLEYGRKAWHFVEPVLDRFFSDFMTACDTIESVVRGSLGFDGPTNLSEMAKERDRTFYNQIDLHQLARLSEKKAFDIEINFREDRL